MSGIIRMIGRAYTSKVFAICNTKFVQNSGIVKIQKWMKIVSKKTSTFG